jgi:hypothetical protein
MFLAFLKACKHHSCKLCAFFGFQVYAEPVIVVRCGTRRKLRGYTQKSQL